ncbi:MAG TPA: metalloregulator ArsR/SmtB family transcription factor [Steroidobacteraceae bacterium]|nr:metalloregulator ArsR/SmtB family transcription factor [Steroidobacteraceae bacterium]
MTRTAESPSCPGTLSRAARELSPHAAEAASLLKAMANEQRLMILCHLVPGPLTVGELNDRVRLSQSALSQHLAVLRESGIVQAERQAQSVHYSLPPGPVMKLLSVLHDEYCSAPAAGAVRRSPDPPPPRRPLKRRARGRDSHLPARAG